jgi:hypothetical protein
LDESSEERIILVGMNGEEPTRPWVLDLGTAQRGMALGVSGQRYDDSEQITFLQEPNMPMIDVRGGPQTKKADIERGEDQK